MVPSEFVVLERLVRPIFVRETCVTGDATMKIGSSAKTAASEKYIAKAETTVDLCTGMQKTCMVQRIAHIYTILDRREN